MVLVGRPLLAVLWLGVGKAHSQEWLCHQGKTPDGKGIVTFMRVKTAEAQKAQNHVTFLMNFSDELRRKVPTGTK